MNDVVLYFGFGINVFYGFREIFQIIDVGDQDIFDVMIVEIGQYVELVVGIFVI